MSGWRRRLLVAAGWVVLGWWGWAALGPSQLGGPVTYTIVSGSSMKPALAAGDLALLRPAGDYQVGEVVAYRTASGATVLHRIIRRVEDRYVFQGDNNSWVDPYLPARAHLVGRLDRRVPKAGWVIEWLQRPVPASILVGVVSFLVGWRHQKRARPARPAAGLTTVLVVTLVVASALGGPALAAINSVPATRLGLTARVIKPNDLKPTQCSALSLTTVVTGSGDFEGTAGNDLILGGSGVDRIRGRSGDDCILGGAGNDELRGDDGTDVCIGGPGTDSFQDCETTLQ